MRTDCRLFLFEAIRSVSLPFWTPKTKIVMIRLWFYFLLHHSIWFKVYTDFFYYLSICDGPFSIVFFFVGVFMGVQIEVIFILTQIWVGLALVWLFSVAIMKEFSLFDFGGSQVKIIFSFGLSCHVSEHISILVTIVIVFKLLILLKLEISTFWSSMTIIMIGWFVLPIGLVQLLEYISHSTTTQQFTC